MSSLNKGLSGILSYVLKYDFLSPGMRCDIFGKVVDCAEKYNYVFAILYQLVDLGLC